ncbi:N-acetylmuramic acid 6-phosphate etherase [Enterococcus malodoratus]|uniref:N-acetylmuramic acid 6-phosphate etherase n=1 Tax=Enterococcus malodoratus TaxID=71451 RepID=UPI0008C331C2|nr:N-acetylmuramic acid 6-phosphate etherase [Enterococcus malodoratus]SET78274.1 N-acetylmuramic acid 6-phosphate etherase [Enterococcus malodoratus]
MKETYIDQLSTNEVLRRINSSDQEIAGIVEKKITKIEEAVELACQKFLQGGRIIYCGAGSSGRIAAMDALEMTPTYGIDPARYFCLLAGGEEAMFRAVEQAEDSEEQAYQELKKVQLNASDVVVAIAASGRTPYCMAALKYGKEIGASTIGISCVETSELGELAEVAIDLPVGKEVVSGSTRMKAGTAQKLVLNMFSTSLMIRLGKVFEEAMIYVQPINQKLVQRSIAILSKIAKITNEEAEILLKENDFDLPMVILIQRLALTQNESRDLLAKHNGNLSKILK